MLGNGNTGKTTYRNLITTGTFTSNYVPTLGVEVVPTERGTIIWDIACQQQYGGMRDAYYIGSNRAIFFADASNMESVKALKNWLRDYKRVCEQSVPEDMVILLTKNDIADANVVDECKKFAKNTKIPLVRISLPRNVPSLEDLLGDKEQQLDYNVIRQLTATNDRYFARSLYSPPTRDNTSVEQVNVVEDVHFDTVS